MPTVQYAETILIVPPVDARLLDRVHDFPATFTTRLAQLHDRTFPALRRNMQNETGGQAVGSDDIRTVGIIG